jgi:hypothetical protein
VTERLNAIREESAEQVLARLERYVETLRERPPVVAPVPFVAPVVVAPNRAPLVDTLIPSRIPSREETPHRRRRFSAEIAPALITVSICSFMILLSQWFDPAFAVVVASVLMLIGVVGLVRGVPLAKAYTFGLVVAALLIRFS